LCWADLANERRSGKPSRPAMTKVSQIWGHLSDHPVPLFSLPPQDKVTLLLELCLDGFAQPIDVFGASKMFMRGFGCRESEQASKRLDLLIAKPTPGDANASFKTAACVLPVSMRCSADLSETAFPLRPRTMPWEFSKVRARPSMCVKSLSHRSAHFLLRWNSGRSKVWQGHNRSEVCDLYVNFMYN
jgi:hypothetical protein